MTMLIVIIKFISIRFLTCSVHRQGVIIKSVEIVITMLVIIVIITTTKNTHKNKR
jgi:hypothetical protein